MGRVATVTIDLQAGEALYIPAGWFHHVENLETTVAVNWWLGQPRVALLDELLRSRPAELAAGCVAVAASGAGGGDFRCPPLYVG